MRHVVPAIVVAATGRPCGRRQGRHPSRLWAGQGGCPQRRHAWPPVSGRRPVGLLAPSPAAEVPRRDAAEFRRGRAYIDLLCLQGAIAKNQHPSSIEEPRRVGTGQSRSVPASRPAVGLDHALVQQSPSQDASPAALTPPCLSPSGSAEGPHGSWMDQTTIKAPQRDHGVACTAPRAPPAIGRPRAATRHPRSPCPASKREARSTARRLAPLAAHCLADSLRATTGGSAPATQRRLHEQDKPRSSGAGLISPQASRLVGARRSRCRQRPANPRPSCRPTGELPYSTAIERETVGRALAGGWESRVRSATIGSLSDCRIAGSALAAEDPAVLMGPRRGGQAVPPASACVLRAAPTTFTGGPCHNRSGVVTLAAVQVTSADRRLRTVRCSHDAQELWGGSAPPNGLAFEKAGPGRLRGSRLPLRGGTVRVAVCPSVDNVDAGLPGGHSFCLLNSARSSNAGYRACLRPRYPRFRRQRPRPRGLHHTHGGSCPPSERNVHLRSLTQRRCSVPAQSS